MKSFISALLLSFLTFFSSKASSITISGKILNSPDGIIIIGNNHITLQKDGSFNYPMEINHNGYFSFNTSKNRASLYLATDTQLTITADENDFENTLKFSGIGSAENQYWAKKNAIAIDWKPDYDLYKLNERDFLQKRAEIKSKFITLLNKSIFTQTDFKQTELRNIHYYEQSNYLQYFMLYFSNENSNTPLSKNFPAFDSNINLENEEEYFFSQPYHEILRYKFKEKINALTPETAAYSFPYAIPEIEKTKSQAIKNFYCWILQDEMDLGNPDYEILYNKLIEINMTQNFKDYLYPKYAKFKALEAGRPSPLFTYENHNGTTTALADLKGEYVYIDVWATWCGPCRQELPFLQKVIQQYKGKNIEFISISVDEQKSHETWSKLITKENLQGTQLFANNAFQSEFIQNLYINAIPRFILIDPKGNILSPGTFRPSDPQLLDLLNSLHL